MSYLIHIYCLQDSLLILYFFGFSGQHGVAGQGLLHDKLLMPTYVVT